MERRKIPDRRQQHTFFSDDRRSGPFDRRNADARLWERAQEMEKIKQIREYKERDVASSTPSATSMFTPRRLVAIGVAVLLLVILLFVFN
jgi:hypothetical protein